MRQIQYKLPNVILTEIPERQLRKDTDVKVRIAYAAVCGSDIHDVSGDFDLSLIHISTCSLCHTGRRVSILSCLSAVNGRSACWKGKCCTLP